MSILETLRQEYTRPFEQIILRWAEEHGLEDLVFYPQDNPTILITWITPDPSGKYLFREIDVLVNDDDSFRVSGGAMYHAPTYHIAWLPYRFVNTEQMEETLNHVKNEVDEMTFESLTDMENYLAVNLMMMNF